VLFDIYRPLAYSTLADLVHHVRKELNFSQLIRVIHLSGCNIQDPTLTFSMQIMSAKLVINLLECIPEKTEFDKGLSLLSFNTNIFFSFVLFSIIWRAFFGLVVSNLGRVLLDRILDTFVNKFSNLRKQIPRLIEEEKEKEKKSKESQPNKLAKVEMTDTTIADNIKGNSFIQSFIYFVWYFFHLDRLQIFFDMFRLSNIIQDVSMGIKEHCLGIIKNNTNGNLTHTTTTTTTTTTTVDDSDPSTSSNE
jgi:hypothetical protein